MSDLPTNVRWCMVCGMAYPLSVSGVIHDGEWVCPDCDASHDSQTVMSSSPWLVRYYPNMPHWVDSADEDTVRRVSDLYESFGFSDVSGSPSGEQEVACVVLRELLATMPDTSDLRAARLILSDLYHSI